MTSGLSTEEIIMRRMDLIEQFCEPCPKIMNPELQLEKCLACEIKKKLDELPLPRKNHPLVKGPDKGFF
jgi:hypothetical protein